LDFENDKELIQNLKIKEMEMVTKSEGLKMAKRCGCCGFFEISAKFGTNFKELEKYFVKIFMNEFLNEKKKDEEETNCIVQ
jgi:hypothetical protein